MDDVCFLLIADYGSVFGYRGDFLYSMVHFADTKKFFVTNIPSVLIEEKVFAMRDKFNIPESWFCTPRTTRWILSTTPPILIMVSTVSIYRRASSSVDSDSPSYICEEAPETDADSTRSISLEQFPLHQLISTQVSTAWDRASTSSFLELVRL